MMITRPSSSGLGQFSSRGADIGSNPVGRTICILLLLLLTGCGMPTFEEQCNEEQDKLVSAAVQYCINHNTRDNKGGYCVRDARDLYCNYVRVK